MTTRDEDAAQDEGAARDDRSLWGDQVGLTHLLFLPIELDKQAAGLFFHPFFKLIYLILIGRNFQMRLIIN